MTQHKAHHVNYLLIFGFLCGLTLASVIADVFAPDNKLVLIVIVLAVAVAKALFVMLFFMHLKFEGNWKYVLLAPTIILAFGLPMALMPDIGVHYYTVDVPQKTQYDTALQAAEHDASNGDHKSGVKGHEADPKGTNSKTKHD